MAKRRFGGFRRKARTFGRRAMKMSRRSGIFGNKSGADLIQFDAMAYGAVRPTVAGFVGNLIPWQHELKDEVTMGVVNWAVAKYVGGFPGQMARKGLTVENARVGEYFGAPLLSGFSSGMAQSVSNPIY